jgi:hypothetical protein
MWTAMHRLAPFLLALLLAVPGAQGAELSWEAIVAVGAALGGARRPGRGA